MGRMSKAAGRATIALAAGFASIGAISTAIRGISQFEGSMSKLAAVSRATSGELANMRAIAKDLGSTTEFSATQAASGLNYLAMAGFSASEGMAAIPDVLNLATAASIDLGQAADIASNIMSGFGIEADKAANVTDVLAAASSRANTTVSQLGGAMSTVAPIAAALNIDLSDTAAAIGVMSDAGIQGERAGTALRGVLAALAGPTKAATDALAKYGLAAKDVNPETHDLADIMETLSERGLTTADAMEIFGREAASGALVLVEANDRLREFGDELRNVDGEATRMADTVRDNLGGDMTSLKSATEGLILAMGDAGLTAVIRGVTQAATALVRGISGTISAITGLFGAIGDFASAQTNLSVAADNVTLAMGDEIRQANALFTLMGNGNTMTQSAALAKLSEAEAHLRNAEALRDETQAMVDQKLAALELQRITAEDALRSIAAPGTDLEQISAMQRESYAETEDFLARIIQKQANLNNLANTGAQEFAAAKAEVERIRTAINNAVDGVVTFDGEVVNAVDLTNRLAQAAGAVNFNNAISSAAFLANDIDVNIELANKLNAALNRSAGIQSSKPKPKFSYGLPGVETGDVGNARLGWGNTLDEPQHERFTVPNLSTSGGSVSSSVSGLSGGGGGSSGGGAAAIDRTKEAYDSLMASLDPVVAATQRFEDAQETVNAALKAGHITSTEAAEAYDLARERFDEAVASADKGASVWEKFKTTGANAIDKLIEGTMSLKDAVSSLIKEMVIAIAKKALLGNGASGSASDSLGSIIMGAFGFADGAAFSGGRVTAFASGGVVNSPTLFPMRGGTGLMGEAGPEAIMPLTRGRNGKLGVQAVGGAAQQVQKAVVELILPPGLSAEQRQEVQGISLRVSEAKMVANSRAQSDQKYLSGGR
jgi:TP901 family phage tail tape measure protein